MGIGANLLLYLTGLNITGPVDTFVIRTLQPIIVLLLAVLILHVKFTKYKMIGIILGLGGALYVSIMPHSGNVKDSFTGDILVFASTVAKSLFLVLIKPYTQKYNAFVVMKWMGLAAFIVTFPFGIRQLLQASLFHTTAPVAIWLEFGFILLSPRWSLLPLGKSPELYHSLCRKRLYLSAPCYRSNCHHRNGITEIFLARPDRSRPNCYRIYFYQQKNTYNLSNR